VVGLAGKLRLRAVPGLDGGTPEGRGHSVWTGTPPQDGALPCCVAPRVPRWVRACGPGRKPCDMKLCGQ
jgi:hypothetical protein